MATTKLKALVNTVIKQSTINSNQITDPTQKFSLAAGSEIEIDRYESAASDHWELVLKTPVNDVNLWFAYKPHVTITGIEPNQTIVLQGKMSTFGGPKDFGVTASEGLALIEPNQLQEFKDYFLPTQPPETSGLARRLNPQTFYIACRWDYKQFSDKVSVAKNILLHSFVTVTNPENGKTTQAKPMDWGPNQNKDRIADLSPGLAKFLGLQTDDEVEVIITLPSH